MSALGGKRTLSDRLRIAAYLHKSGLRGTACSRGLQVTERDPTTHSIDPVSDILKWVLLATAIICFAMLGWATVLTYEQAPPHPLAFTDRAGNVLMTADDISAGKGGFQKADLMDYGSIYGMGSSFGEDYTASTLVRERPERLWSDDFVPSAIDVKRAQTTARKVAP